MGKKESTLIPLLKRYKEDIGSKIRVEKLILFGSQATGHAKETSDVDLLIVSKDFTGKKYFQRSPELYLLWNHGYDVDLICLTPEELAERKWQIGIIKQALKVGIEI